jgi:hypothetical protein
MGLITQGRTSGLDAMQVIFDPATDLDLGRGDPSSAACSAGTLGSSPHSVKYIVEA